MRMKQAKQKRKLEATHVCYKYAVALDDMRTIMALLNNIKIHKNSFVFFAIARFVHLLQNKTQVILYEPQPYY